MIPADATVPSSPSRPSTLDPGPAGAEARALAGAMGLSLTAADVLARAGHVAGDALGHFLEPKLAHLTPPDAMADLAAFVDRVAFAIERGERIAVFGDYDCDGITACATITEILRGLGGVVSPLLATRREGAYGLSAPAIERVRAASPALLITCDCGSSDHERIDTLRSAGIDTLVIDHHLVPAEPLPARAFLNPHRPDCGFSYKWLASCGLALTVGAVLRRRMKKELELRRLLDLVAIGTIADVAPLTEDNRALVRAGLQRIRAGARPGLRALGDIARFDFSRGVNAEDVAFRLAPRLNAPGRLGDPDPALDLLLCDDPVTAGALAASVEQLQLQRRALQAEMVDQANRQVTDAAFDREAGIVVADARWHAGIVGIVAGRLADALDLPTVVIAIEGAAGRGSVRGPRGFPLHDALTLCKDTLIGFGGHQAAAGLHVAADRIDAFRASWVDACRTLAATVPSVQKSRAAATLDPSDDPMKVVEDLERLEPCGEGNPLPLLFLPGASVVRARNYGAVLKLDLDYHGRALTGVCFQAPDVAQAIAGKRLDLVGALRRNTYAGGVELQVSFADPPFASFAAGPVA